MKISGAYEKLFLVPVAPVGCYKQFCLTFSQKDVELSMLFSDSKKF